MLDADVKGLAKNERFGSEPVGVRRSGEHRHDCEFLQGAHRVGVGICAQDSHRLGELVACLGAPAPFAQCPPGNDPGPGGGSVLAVPAIVGAGSPGIVHGRGKVAVRDGSLGGAFPKGPGRWLPLVLIRRGQLGRGGVTGRGAGGGAGALGAFAGPDQGADGLAADVGDVGIIWDGVQRVQVVAGDHVGHFLAIVGEDGTQVRGHGQMPGLAIPPRQGVVGDLAQHLLSESVAAAFGRQRIRGHR